MTMETPKIIPLPVIVGPTASGKTALSIEFAKRLDGEIVSADSMQIYDTLRIGTARPTFDEMDGIPHHLMGFLPLSQPYSVAQYVKDAKKAIDNVRSRDHQPILCGGTGLYVQSLIENIAFSEQPSYDGAYREELRLRAAEQGGELLLAELAEIDPEAAARLHPNDTGRIIRALELHRTTGMTVSEHNLLSRTQPSPYDACVILLTFRDRQTLYARINLRVDKMLEEGLLEEAKTILGTPYAPTAMQAIGYKELAPYFAGEISLPDATERIKQGTRRYAKRQLSWFRRMDTYPLYREDYETEEQLVEAAVQIWTQHRCKMTKGE